MLHWVSKQTSSVAANIQCCDEEMKHKAVVKELHPNSPDLNIIENLCPKRQSDTPKTLEDVETYALEEYHAQNFSGR